MELLRTLQTSKSVGLFASLTAAAILDGCTCVPFCKSGAKLYESPQEQVVTARIQAFRANAEHLDYDGFAIDYNAIDLIVQQPSSARYSKLSVLYQDIAKSGEIRLELGQMVTFTAPVVRGKPLEGPYLAKLTDLKLAN